MNATTSQQWLQRSQNEKQTSPNLKKLKTMVKSNSWWPLHYLLSIWRYFAAIKLHILQLTYKNKSTQLYKIQTIVTYNRRSEFLRQRISKFTVIFSLTPSQSRYDRVKYKLPVNTHEQSNRINIQQFLLTVSNTMLSQNHSTYQQWIIHLQTRNPQWLSFKSRKYSFIWCNA